MSDINLVGSRDAVGMDLGKRLNLTDTVSPCPVCKSAGRLEVFEKAARWSCGCVRVLPPLSDGKAAAAKKQKKAAAQRARVVRRAA